MILDTVPNIILVPLFSKTNEDNYTLYVINVDDTEDSKIATDIYNEVKTKYKNYKIYTNGNISAR